MPTSKNDVLALCPYYQYDESASGHHKVVCEGIFDDTNCVSIFRTKQQLQNHIDFFCCEQFYLCPLYQALQRKYETESNIGNGQKKRMIYAEDLINSFDFSVIASEFKGKKPSDWERMFRFRVNNTPSVYAAPIVRGKLKGLCLSEYRGFLASCANCGTENIFPCKYCRECGAKFDF